MTRLWLQYSLLASLACTLAPAGPASAQGWPWGSGRHPVTAEVGSGSERAGSQWSMSAVPPFNLALEFWHQLLSRVDGPRCQHQPSCSAYAGQALSRYGAVPGLLLVLDRLWRGASSSSQRLLRRHRGRWFDPLSEAEFWRPGYLPMSGR